MRRYPAPKARPFPAVRRAARIEKGDKPVFWTILCSIVTALITTKLAYRGDVLKAIRDSREELYTEILENIEKLTDNSEYVFTDEFKNFLVGAKYRVQLIASNRFVKAYKELHNLCLKKKKKYDAWSREHNPIENLVDEDEVLHAAEIDLTNYNNMDVVYCAEHAPSPEKVTLLVRNILREMRFDMGNAYWEEICNRFLDTCRCIKKKVYSAIKNRLQRKS